MGFPHEQRADMKAVIFHSPQSVELSERSAPQPRSDRDNLLRVIACGLCGSDLRAMTDSAQMACTPNTVMGHEIVGRIEIPAPGSGFAEGDVVVVVPNIPCRVCFNCKRGLINLCDNFEHIGSHTDGGLAEQLWAATELLHRVPEGLDPQVAALAEPLACVLNGTTRASWRAGEPVVVLGGGPIGLLFAAVAKLSGAAPLVVSEPSEVRRRLALEMGADHVVDPTAPGATEQIAELVGGHGAPVVMDTLGTLLSTALQVVAKGGEIFVFGVNHAAAITIAPAVIVDKEVSIHGVFIAKGTFPLALQLLADHSQLFAKVVSDRILIDDWETAETLLMSGQTAGKILVTMESS